MTDEEKLEDLREMIDVATDTLERLEESGLPANLAAGSLAIAIGILVENVGEAQELVRTAHNEVNAILAEAKKDDEKKEMMN